MADTEKGNIPVIIQQPPAYTSSEPHKSKKTTVALSVYGAVVTTLLIVGAIFGGLLYSQSLNQCKQDAPTDPSMIETRTDEYEGDDGQKFQQDVQLDYQKEAEVIHVHSDGSSWMDAVVVLDYKRSMTGMYVPSADQCYIIGGVDKDFKNPFQVSGDDEGDEAMTKLSLRQADGMDLVHDMSVVPFYLRPHCEGKDIFWLEKAAGTDVGRQKRRPSIEVTVTVTFHPLRIRVRVRL